MQKTVDLRMHRGFLQFVGTEQVEGIGWRGSATVLVEIEVPRSAKRGWGININRRSALPIAKELACALRNLGQSEGCHDMREIVTQAGVEGDAKMARGRWRDA